MFWMALTLLLTLGVAAALLWEVRQLRKRLRRYEGVTGEPYVLDLAKEIVPCPVCHRPLLGEVTAATVPMLGVEYVTVRSLTQIHADGTPVHVQIPTTEKYLDDFEKEFNTGEVGWCQHCRRIRQVVRE
jgi:hypothetical protein